MLSNIFSALRKIGRENKSAVNSRIQNVQNHNTTAMASQKSRLRSSRFKFTRSLKGPYTIEAGDVEAVDVTQKLNGNNEDNVNHEKSWDEDTMEVGRGCENGFKSRAKNGGGCQGGTRRWRKTKSSFEMSILRKKRRRHSRTKDDKQIRYTNASLLSSINE